MNLSFFNFEFYNYQGSFFGSFCILEYCIEYNDCNYVTFNSNFFDKYDFYNHQPSTQLYSKKKNKTIKR
jgi:hypothetical protein